MTNVQGTVAAGWEPVRDVFERNFTELGEVGAGVAVYAGGELVVDLTGGVHDGLGGAYDADSLQLVFSTTKGIAAMCAHVLVQRGLLDLDAPVAELWPEFAAAGKDQVTSRMVLEHSAGLPVVDQALTMPEILEVGPIVDALAAQAPVWEPGTDHGYHALTYGWLVGEIVRRVDGRDIGTFLAEEIAGPLGAEAWIGLAPEQDHRVAPLVAMTPPDGPPDMSALTPEIIEMLPEMMQVFSNPDSIGIRALTLNGAMSLDGEGLAYNDPRVWRSQIPAANGITNARSLARLYAACVGEVDGVRILDEATTKAATVEHRSGKDRSLVVPTRFGLGFMLKSTFCRMLGPASFGHPGAGGSLGCADPDTGIGFGYVMRKMGVGLGGDARVNRLLEAVEACA